MDALEALRPRLELQLGGEVEACTKGQLEDIQKLLDADELEKADEAIVKRRADLTFCAVAHLPVLAEDDFMVSAEGYGYLSSPLGRGCLPGQMVSRLPALEAKWILMKSQPWC